MKFDDIYRLKTESKISVEEGARLLGIHERTLRRWVCRYEEEGEVGLLDRRLRRKANNAATDEEIVDVVELYRRKYSGFNMSHFYDKYRELEGGGRSYNWVRNCLQTCGIKEKQKKTGCHRQKRERKPFVGMMLHQDGSQHYWIEDEQWDLIVTMDDANNEIYSAFFVEEEGTFSSFEGVKEVIEKKGIFCSLYVDRGTHYFITEKAGQSVSKTHITQFGRAMKQIGIELIAAYSPEARGRSERVFKTLQDRLPKELKLEGITTMKKANEYLKKTFIPSYNKRFCVKPIESDSAFIEWKTNHISIDDVLCIQEERTVKNDNTINYKGKILQIQKDKHRYNYNKAKVHVHEYVNKDIAIFYGHRKLGVYDKYGKMKPVDLWTSPSDQPKPFGTCGQAVNNLMENSSSFPQSYYTTCPHSLASRPQGQQVQQQ